MTREVPKPNPPVLKNTTIHEGVNPQVDAWMPFVFLGPCRIMFLLVLYWQVVSMG